MIKIKKIFCILITIIAVYTIYINFNNINITFGSAFDQIFYTTPSIITKESNSYQKSNNYAFIKSTDNFVPQNYQDILNIYYTVLNNGWDNFTFYCPESYQNCLKDLQQISNDEELLSNINNFVDPRNSYSTIKTLYDETGEINIKINHLYSNKEIEEINAKIDQIIKEKINNEMSDQEKIKVLHNYIINNTKYDRNAADHIKTEYDSSRIGGVLYDHYAICSGYTDTMAVFLTKLNFDNFKVSSANHIWNAVKIDNTWYHLDLTWDDPVGEKDELKFDYFLISTNKLEEIDKEKQEHVFNKNIFQELK